MKDACSLHEQQLIEHKLPEGEMGHVSVAPLSQGALLQARALSRGRRPGAERPRKSVDARATAGRTRCLVDENLQSVGEMQGMRVLE